MDILTYLRKTDIDKSFNTIKSENLPLPESSFQDRCDTIKKIKDELLSDFDECIKIHEGNLADLIKAYKIKYQEYTEKFASGKQSRYSHSYSYLYGKMESEDEYIAGRFGNSYHTSRERFEKYSKTKEDEDSSLYFQLHKNNQSKLSFSFCVYYNSENILCIDKLLLKKGRRDLVLAETSTKTVCSGQVKEFLEKLASTNDIQKQKTAERHQTQQDENLKKEKVKRLKQKAGIVNIKKVVDNIDCSYAIEEMKLAFKIHIALSKGTSVIKIPKKDLNEKIQYLEEFVKTIIKADKLKIHFNHQY